MKNIIDQVYPKIVEHLVVTSLIKSQHFSGKDQQLYFKMENQQITGSFKLRGVLSKFVALKEQGVVTDQVVAASTGNHALAVCHAAKEFGSRPVIFVPATVSSSKLTKLKDLGVELFQQGSQSGETEQIAITYAKENNLPLIHPYNDQDVIAGQGTIGLEIVQQLDSIDQVFVPVGGGGLISGIASYMKGNNPKIRIIGVQPQNACEMADSIDKGYIVAPSDQTTVSDGTAGGLDPETMTIGYCKQLVDHFIRVTEEEILMALRKIQQDIGEKVEPAAGLALAGFTKAKQDFSTGTSVAIICGGNIDDNRYRSLINDSASGKP
jgi:threonine dehydratase